LTSLSIALSDKDVVMNLGNRSCVCSRAAAALVLLGLSVTAAGAEPGKRRATTKEGKTPEPFVAVDNVCAWPNLTLLRDGTIVATIFNKPSHGAAPGDVECWASRDGGQTWTLAGTPTAHEPDTVRMNHAAGLAANGDLIVLCAGWSNRYPEGKQGRPFRAHTLDPWVCRSSDGGRTWSVDKKQFPIKGPNGEEIGVCNPFGDIAVGSDGKLRAAIYTSTYVSRYEEKRPKRPNRVLILRSPDDGKTWGEPCSLDPDNELNETAPIHLGDGKWLAAARSNGLQLYQSVDDAKTWKCRGAVTANSRHPGHLLRLRDGRILLTYGNRTKDRGVDVRTSGDEGQTWSEPVRVLDFQGDGGYPASVQRGGGQIVTACYASRTEKHPRYHVAIVIWDPEKSLKP
jgi:hypothetical protein